MSYLVIGDLHLTDRPQDASRFRIFEWIRKQQLAHKPTATFLLGDIADSKDKHSAILVNKLVAGLEHLVKPVLILKGNHDYIDPKNPFFEFLNLMEGVTFVTTPDGYENVLLIPHIRDERDFANAFQGRYRPDYLLLHNTFQGAIAETGAPLTGFSIAPIKALAPRLGTYAGDVHKPQQAGPVTYVGSPYTIRFGDNFEPRVLLLDGKGGQKNLYFDCPRKWKLLVRDYTEIMNDKRLLKGDQVKVTIELAREEVTDWQVHKKDALTACETLGLEVFGVDFQVNTNTQKDRVRKSDAKSDDEILIKYCKKEGLPASIKEVGLAFLNA